MPSCVGTLVPMMLSPPMTGPGSLGALGALLIIIGLPYGSAYLIRPAYFRLTEAVLRISRAACFSQAVILYQRN
jgi:hypothetical protein